MFRIFHLFIYFILLLSYVKVSILLCIYSLYYTYLRNCKMMFVLFFLFMTYLFVISLFNLALAALPLPLYIGSHSQIVSDWSKEPWCICVGYAHWSVRKRESVETDFIFLRTYSVSDLCVYRKTCTYTLRKL